MGNSTGQMAQVLQQINYKEKGERVIYRSKDIMHFKNRQDQTVVCQNAHLTDKTVIKTQRSDWYNNWDTVTFGERKKFGLGWDTWKRLQG